MTPNSILQHTRIFKA